MDYVATRKHAARNRAMLLITHLAGLRVGEVAALRINDVLDADGSVRNEIRLDADQTKGYFARVVFVNEKLRKELTKYLSQYAPVNHDQKLFYRWSTPRSGFVQPLVPGDRRQAALAGTPLAPPSGGTAGSPGFMMF